MTDALAHRHEKTWLLGALGAVVALITAVVIWQTHHLIAPTWVVATAGVVWAGSAALLRANQSTIGREGKFVDWWSIPHFTTGILFGLLGVRLAYVVGIAITWEIVEVFANTKEYPTNRATDVVLAAAGWALATLLAGARFVLV